jgi:hypothetical protein
MAIQSKFVICILLFFMGLTPVMAQKVKPAGKLSEAAYSKLYAAEDSMIILAYVVLNDSSSVNRYAACRTLITTLVRALKHENSFRYRFDRLKSVSILTPPDSSFRIFTWQLFVNDSTYRYYGAIQRNQRDLKLHPLIDRSFEMGYKPVKDIHTPEKWYGALYYNILHFDTKEGRKYLLFGFDAYTFFEKRKVLDILQFDATGKPTFGSPIFTHSEAKNGADSRLLLEYSAEVKVRLNWDEQYKMIIFDHLIPFSSPFGRGVTWVPDGSYEGYKWQKGRWNYIPKVFNDIQNEAPREDPVLDRARGRDILGRPPKEKRPKLKK